MRPRLAVLPLAAALAFGAGCSRDAPLEPLSDQSTLAPTASISASQSALPGDGAVPFAGDLEDIPVRVLPGFSDRDAADSLAGYLTELLAHLSAGNKTAAARVLGQARELLKPGVADPADIGYLQLVFDNIEAAIQ
jgi:hypothetical protein